MRAHFPEQRLVIEPTIAMDGKEGHGLRLEKGWANFFKIQSMHAKITKEKCLVIPDEQLMKIV